ncbi:MAG: ctc [Planctomycetaceae bacterium]|nr:ctc [Planctomycetaceae bacterium]
MHTEAELVVEPRKQRGSLEARRLRRAGFVPGNIYGHGQPPVMMFAKDDAIVSIIKHKVRVINVTLDGKVEKCMLQEVQWDTFGNYLKHFDVLRIDPNERITVEVPVELRGTAPGMMRGGVLEHGSRHLTVRCLAYMVPDVIVAKIGGLDLDQALHVKDIEVPEGMEILNNPETIVIRIGHIDAARAAAAAASSAPAEGSAAGPEVIGKKPTEEEDKAAAGDKGKGKK